MTVSLAVGQQPGSAAAEADPTTALRDDLYHRGIEACDQGRWDEALPLHERLVRLNPHYGFGWMGLGWSRQYTGDPDGALEAFARALQLGGMPHGHIQVQMAECHLAAGRRDAALQELTRALEAGYPRREQLKTRRDLAGLRDDPQFRALIRDLDVAGLTRSQGWNADLDLLASEIRRLLYRPERVLTTFDLDAELQAIRAAIERERDDALYVRVMKLMRRLGDGHTQADPPAEMDGRTIPVLIGQFADGLFVTATDEGQRELLWSRVDAINEVPVADVFQRLDAIVSCDNAMRLGSQGPMMLRHPDILRGLGIGDSSDSVALRLTRRDGRTVETQVAVGPTPEAWLRLPDGAQSPLPRYGQRRAEYYWFERVPESSLVFLQYNACGEMETRPMEAFADELIAAIEQQGVEALVVDLRWNGGGNMFTSRPLLSRILTCRKLQQPGALFVIVGRHTFSAAMLFAGQLERYTPAVFVGEPTGSSPNFVGETNLFTLPYSRMRISISNLYWQTAPAMDTRPWIAPQIPVPPRFSAWAAGRDEALEAILDLKRRP